MAPVSTPGGVQSHCSLLLCDCFVGTGLRTHPDLGDSHLAMLTLTFPCVTLRCTVLLLSFHLLLFHAGWPNTSCCPPGRVRVFRSLELTFPVLGCHLDSLLRALRHPLCIAGCLPTPAWPLGWTPPPAAAIHCDALSSPSKCSECAVSPFLYSS